MGKVIGETVKKSVTRKRKTEEKHCKDDQVSKKPRINELVNKTNKVDVKNLKSSEGPNLNSTKARKKPEILTSEKTDWKDFELLADLEKMDLVVAKTITEMFDEGCTIPFIARYRRAYTGNMSAEMLREIKQRYDQINAIKVKLETVLKKLESGGHLTPILKKSLLSAKSLDEIDHIYAPYKSTNKKTLFERAKKLGLEKPAIKLLTTDSTVNLNLLVNRSEEDLNTYEKVEAGIVHILAHIVATDLKVLTHLRKLRADQNFTIEVKKTLKRDKTLKTKQKSKVKEEKYENYYEFKSTTRFIKSYQVKG